jgi:NitT/TauT family transport system permease protein
MKKKQTLYLWFGIFSIFIVWYIAGQGIENALILPSFGAVFRALCDLLARSEVYLLVAKTFLKLIIIMVISFSLSLTAAQLSFRSRKFEHFLRPYISLIKTIPVVSIIILLLIVFGNRTSPYILTALVIIPILYEGILSAFRNISQDILDEVRMISITNMYVIRHVFVPILFPAIMSSILQSFGLGLKVMIMGEFIAQPFDSIGYRMQLEKINLNTAGIMAWTIILAIVVLCAESAVSKMAKSR